MNCEKCGRPVSEVAASRGRTVHSACRVADIESHLAAQPDSSPLLTAVCTALFAAPFFVAGLVASVIW